MLTGKHAAPRPPSPPPQNLLSLQEAVEHELAAAGLQPVPTFVQKIMQLHQTLDVRFGVTVVGAAGSGKSAAWQVLCAARSNFHRRHTDGAADAEVR